MKTLIVLVLSLVLTAPAYAWRPVPYPVYYPYPYYPTYNGVSPGAAAGIGAGALGLGVLAGLLIGKAIANRNEAEKNMLDSAARANQYENYLIGLQYYNANSKKPVTPFSKDQWIQWRTSNGLETLR